MTTESPTPTPTPENPETPETLSRTQIWHRARKIMKSHEIMDGSGHLHLKNRAAGVTEEQIAQVQAYVLAGLVNQGIPESHARSMDARIAAMLCGLVTRRPPPKPRPRRPKPPKPQANRRTEPRQVIVQVTVKKARSFHYPRDLQSGDGGDE
ncbi:MAG: hypothetical protein ACYCS8_12785 [Acidithiobacillus sp.]